MELKGFSSGRQCGVGYRIKMTRLRISTLPSTSFITLGKLNKLLWVGFCISDTGTMTSITQDYCCNKEQGWVSTIIIIALGRRQGAEFMKHQYARHCIKCPTSIIHSLQQHCEEEHYLLHYRGNWRYGGLSNHLFRKLESVCGEN